MDIQRGTLIPRLFALDAAFFGGNLEKMREDGNANNMHPTSLIQQIMKSRSTRQRKKMMCFSVVYTTRGYFKVQSASLRDSKMR